MGTDKPLISILLAVYEPQMDWLRELLESLEAQTYPNLKLYVRDDCSSAVPYAEIEKCVHECIWSFPCEMRRNERNLGSNLTFQRLTREAEGEYFAYCDQDDVWLPEKLEILHAAMERTCALLVCSDMYIIDGEGKRTADSITKIRRHHVFKSGTDLASELLVHNFVTGCTMLIEAKAAKAAIPFCPYMVHDHYLALWAAASGRIQSVNKQLVSYRIHGSNQTALLAGVKDKKSYGEVRIDMMVDRLQWLREHFPCGSDLKEVLNDGVLWAEARKTNWAHCGGKATVWKYRHFSKVPSMFEIVADRLPEPLFRLAILAGKRNMV